MANTEEVQKLVDVVLADLNRYWRDWKEYVSPTVLLKPHAKRIRGLKDMTLAEFAQWMDERGYLRLMTSPKAKKFIIKRDFYDRFGKEKILNSLLGR